MDEEIKKKIETEMEQFNVKSFIEGGIKESYLEQMKVEAPSESEAMARFNDIVDFLVDCVPEYQPNSDQLPLRMQIVELLFTKNPKEIKEWFDDRLKSDRTLYQHRAQFERLRENFFRQTPYACSFSMSESLWVKYKRQYDDYDLPKGYTTVSMIWGGILGGGCKYTSGIANFFIQCAEDNALCTLESYAEENHLKCKSVSWYAFQRKNKCKDGKCKDSNCKKGKCKGKDFNCLSIEHKDLCRFCKLTFKTRASKALKIDEDNIDIDNQNVSSDSDEETIDGILSFK